MQRRSSEFGIAKMLISLQVLLLYVLQTELGSVSSKRHFLERLRGLIGATGIIVTQTLLIRRIGCAKGFSANIMISRVIVIQEYTTAEACITDRRMTKQLINIRLQQTLLCMNAGKMQSGRLTRQQG